MNINLFVRSCSIMPLEQYNEAIIAFNLWMKQAGYSDTTKKEYAREIRNFLTYLDGLSLERIKKLTIVSYLVQEKENVSDGARNRSRSEERRVGNVCDTR